MIPQEFTQFIPTNWEKRESLREKGQFWTPDWIAEAMVSYVLFDDPGHVFDPAVGAGAFLRAAKIVSREKGKDISLFGTEIHENAIEEATRSGLSPDDLANIEIRDFIISPPDRKFRAIVANPPYIRHHRMSRELKDELKNISRKTIGEFLDGRAGLHVYFLIRALELLETNGRLAFIMPSDTVEGKFSSSLWKWITKKYKLDAVMTFTPETSPFPKVDVNAIIFFIKNEAPIDCFQWSKLIDLDFKAPKDWVLSNFRKDISSLNVVERKISEGLQTGLSRQPIIVKHNGPILKDYATTMRGIASGDNGFFLLTKAKATEIGIPDEFLRTVVSRTRDVNGNTITKETIEKLEKDGRPTLLLCLDGRPFDQFPKEVRDYLNYGERIGLPARPLIQQRKPWYKMEKRQVPEFLFAYLGRRNARFIRNLANVLPMTGFLCVYPKSDDLIFLEELWNILQHPQTVSNLSIIGKSYGQGAIKVEPRSLEKLPLPFEINWEINSHAKLIQDRLI